MKRFPEDGMKHLSALEGVQVGDRFLRYDGGWTPRLQAVECTKVTPKQCEIGGQRYRIADAEQIGRGTWSRLGSLMNYDREKYREAQQEERLRVLRAKLADQDWRKVDDEVVEAVWAFLSTQKPAAAASSQK